MLLSKRRINKLKTSWKRLPSKLTTIKNLAIRKIQNKQTPKVAFKISGGLGDHIASIRFIRDFCSTTGVDRYDIYCTKPAIVKWLLETEKKCALVCDAKAFDKSLASQYELALSVTTALHIDHYAPGEFSKTSRNFSYHITKIKQSVSKITPIIQHHPYLDGYLGHYAATLGFRRHNHVHAMADIRYGGHALNLPMDESALTEFDLKPNAYITVSNGFDQDFHTDAHTCPTKAYPYHNDVIRHLKQQLPGVKFIHIGSVASAPLDQCDLNLVNATSLRQVAALLKNALHHLDNEGGLVHTAASLGTPCTVVFGPTLPTYFGYEENNNIGPNECGGCWWMEKDWMSRCIRGFDRPPCMVTQTPEAIANRITQTIDGMRSKPEYCKENNALQADV